MHSIFSPHWREGRLCARLFHTMREVMIFKFSFFSSFFSHLTWWVPGWLVAWLALELNIFVNKFIYSLLALCLAHEQSPLFLIFCNCNFSLELSCLVIAFCRHKEVTHNIYGNSHIFFFLFAFVSIVVPWQGYLCGMWLIFISKELPQNLLPAWSLWGMLKVWKIINNFMWDLWSDFPDKVRICHYFLFFNKLL